MWNGAASRGPPGVRQRDHRRHPAGKGPRDDAEDTVRLVALFRRHWPATKGQTPVKEAYLDEAEADATELLARLDAGETFAKGSPRDLRQRAYTHWLSAYVELLHLGRYLERDDPAAAERFPAVYAERGTSARQLQTAPAPPAAAPEASPAPAPAAAPPAASAQDGGGPAPV